MLLVSNTPSVQLRYRVTPAKLCLFCSGIKVEDDFPGVYEWNGVDVPSTDKDAATLTFTNWDPGKTVRQSLISDMFDINIDIFLQSLPLVRDVWR